MFTPDRTNETLHRGGKLLPSALALAVVALFTASGGIGPTGGAAQDVEQEEPRPLVAHEVSVSGQGATLRLEFEDGEGVQASLQEGVLTLNGEDLGTVPEASPLTEAWRELLGELAPMGPADAVDHLQEWELPDGLEGEPAEAGAALREVLQGTVAVEATPEPAGTLPETDRLAQLSGAVEDLEFDDPRLYVGRDVRVEADEEIAGGLVVLNGNLVLEGRVDGHVVVLGGTVDLEEGATVTGNLTVSDGQVRGERGVVEGSIVEGVEGLEAVDPGAVSEAVEEAMAEAEAQARNGIGLRDAFSPLAHLGSGIANLIRLAVLAALLALVGLGLLHFAPRNLDLASRACREDTGRSALVGLATIVLAFPLWVAGIVALAVSVIGIPLLLIWLPLFWATLGLLGLFGFVAVAYRVGEALDEGRFEAMDWMRGRSAFHHLATGVVVLLAPFALAAVVSMAGPILSWLEVLLQLVGWLLAVTAITIGTGAVLLTRGGRRPSPAPPSPEEPGPEPSRPEPEAGGSAGDEPAWSTAEVDETPPGEDDRVDPEGGAEEESRDPSS